MKRTSLGSLIAAAAVGALMTATAPAVHAEPKLSERTIKSECEEAGGSYDSQTRKGQKVSTCAYPDSGGVVVFDVYLNGEYQGTI